MNTTLTSDRAAPRALAVALLLGCIEHAPAQTHVTGWGSMVVNSAWHAETFVHVAAGFHSVALRGNGSYLAWGTNTRMQCEVPVLPPGVWFVEVAAGRQHTVARRSDGSVVVAWFEPDPMNGTYDLTAVPALPSGLSYVEVAAGDNHCLARRSDGRVVAWGDNLAGQCNVPPLPPGLGFAEITGGGAHSLARRSDGSVVAWGHNLAGQCNVPTLPPGIGFVEIAGGRAHSLARRSDGTVVAWGDNLAGQCNVPSLPTAVAYVEIAAGGLHSVARRSDGVLLAWGDNSFGQCTVPALPAGTTWVEIAAGATHSIARRSDGVVICWGDNSAGQCNFPALPGGRRYVDVAATWSGQIVALRDDGQVLVTGGNTAVPALPAGLTFTSVATGSQHIVARRSDGQVVAWGDNSQGQCNLPALPAGLTWLAAWAGAQHTMLHRSDGQYFGVGDNAAGQCNVPPAPAGLVYIACAGGTSHSLGLLSDGSVVAWGDNSLGQCTGPLLPAGVHFVEITASQTRSIARRSDGLISEWGGPPTPPGCNLYCPWLQDRLPPPPPGLCYVEVSGGGQHTWARLSDGSHVESGFRGGFMPIWPHPCFRLKVALLDDHPASYVAQGAGCNGSLGVSRLVPQTLPRVGTDLIVNIGRLPAGMAFLATGWSDQTSPWGPLPFDLSGAGMGGCALRVSPDSVQMVSGPNEWATFSLRLPHVPGLIGIVFYQQALIPDPVVGNASPAIMSDSARATVGSGP